MMNQTILEKVINEQVTQEKLAMLDEIEQVVTESELTNDEKMSLIHSQFILADLHHKEMFEQFEALEKHIPIRCENCNNNYKVCDCGIDELSDDVNTFDKDETFSLSDFISKSLELQSQTLGEHAQHHEQSSNVTDEDEFDPEAELQPEPEIEFQVDNNNQDEKNNVTQEQFEQAMTRLFDTVKESTKK